MPLPCASWMAPCLARQLSSELWALSRFPWCVQRYVAGRAGHGDNILMLVSHSLSSPEPAEDPASGPWRRTGACYYTVLCRTVILSPFSSSLLVIVTSCSWSQWRPLYILYYKRGTVALSNIKVCVQALGKTYCSKQHFLLHRGPLLYCTRAERSERSHNHTPGWVTGLTQFRRRRKDGFPSSAASLLHTSHQCFV